MESVIWLVPVIGSQLMGLGDKLRGRRTCPVCKGPVDTALRSAALLCKSCDTYLDVIEGELKPVPEGSLAKDHMFGAPTPWKDIRAVTFPGALSAPVVQITDLMLTKKAGIRLLDAQWPTNCCVCGSAASRRERIARTVIFPREWGIFNIGSQKATVVADVPHCAEHAGGCVFDRVFFAIATSDPAFGLCFRSLTFRNAFRKLNPWPWPRY